MGMTLGGLLFALGSYKWEVLRKTAFHCFLLSLIFIPPTVILGIMDWLYRYHGRMDSYIAAKFILAAVYTLLLCVALYVDHKAKADYKTVTFLYILCVLLTIGLGFAGGSIIFG
jgi:hypothetical protein